MERGAWCGYIESSFNIFISYLLADAHELGTCRNFDVDNAFPTNGSASACSLQDTASRRAARVKF